MSTRYPGGVITKTPVVPAGPFEDGAAPGIWTLDQQLQAAKAGIWPTAGSVDPSLFIENLFSTYLVTPTTSNTTYSVTNGIDVSGKGGMVWMKARSAGSTNNLLYDTVRGASSIANNALISNSSSAQQTANFDYITGLSNGFTVNFASGGGQLTNNGINYASWTFREQPKFFDIVTYTGNGVAGRTVAHNLTSTPGFVLIKNATGANSWVAWHRSRSGETGVLNSTGAFSANQEFFLGNDVIAINPTSANFTVATDAGVNASGNTYIAYLFAHDAGGFGAAGTENVISCGSVVNTGNPQVTLGYEPQWVLFKSATSTSAWYIVDNMRGLPVGANQAVLIPNSTAAEVTNSEYININATGFKPNSSLLAGETLIYIAIRRGPMKVPTVGTSVFTPLARTGTGTNPTVVTTGTNPDLLLSFPRTASPAAYGTVFFDKLRGVSQILQSANTNAEATTAGTLVLQSFLNTGFQAGADFAQGYLNYSGSTYVNYAMTRAPGFFDEVCYTGTGANTTQTHNLAAVPELIIVKPRNAVNDWSVYASSIGNGSAIFLNQDIASFANGTFWNSTTPTASVFSLGTQNRVNTSADLYVAYLFATVAGVSKVGSYTGNGTTQTIDCGFGAGGARFVLIKRTNSTGDWYVYDTARGMTVLTDPYLLLNSTAAEAATLGSVTTVSTGFALNSTILAAINVNAGSYIFLAIA